MDTINIVFRFFDFFVVVGILFYGIKHYVIPTVEKMLREHGLFIYNLESDCKNLQLQADSIYENIQDQERQFKAMEARFAIWQQKCNERVVIQKTKQQQTDDAMQGRFVVKLEYIQNDNLMQKQLPVILDETTKALEHKYHGSDQQKQYIDTLIHVMKEQS